MNFLTAVLSVADAAVRISLDRKEAYKIIDSRAGFDLSVEKKCAFICNLRKSGYIEDKTDGGSDSIQFTDKAKLRVLDKICESLEWDGKYRFVSFDIPEKYRLNRDGFRRAIKRMGFRQIQKSLWVCKKNVSELVEIVAIHYKVKKYMIYIVSEKSDIDTTIKKILISD